jgi:hypothetical protein
MSHHSRVACLGIVILGSGIVCLPHPVAAATITVSTCNAADLIAAINTANGNGQADTISITTYGCTFNLTAVDNSTDGANGLPSVTTNITINGNGAKIQRGSGTFRIFHVAAGGTFALNELTIASGAGSVGAGIYNRGNLSLSHVTMTANTATGPSGANGGDYGGGGGGAAGGLGGAIYNDGGSVSVVNSTLSGNIARGGTGGNGGASCCYGGSGAGAVGLLGNGGRGGDGGGAPGSLNGGAGGVFAGGGGAGVNITSPWGAGGAGGTLGGNGGNDNHSGSGPGAVGGGGAGAGGAIFTNGGTVTLTNSTILNNQAVGGSRGSSGLTSGATNGQGAGGGVYNYNSATFKVYNCLIAGDTADSGPDFYGAVTQTNNANLLGSLSGSTGFGASEVISGSLSNVVNTTLGSNGGKTQTHALISGGAAVDHGSNTEAPSTGGDQRGYTRIVDGDGVGGAVVDVGSYELARPEIDVQVSGTSIPSGGTFTYPNTVLGTPVDVTFTVLNAAAALDTLILDGFSLQVTGNFQVLSSFGSTTFQIRFLATIAGTQTGDVTFSNNDSNESPYTIHLSALAGAPNMGVWDGATAIADGQVAPVDLGTTAVGGSGVSRVFTIRNSGTYSLDLTGSPHVALSGDTTDFTVSPQPTTPIASGGGSTTFTVVFDPTVAGLRSVAVSIPNSDAGKNPYNFTIQGTGCESPFVVTSSADSGAGTLRDGIASVCDNGTITFDASLANTTITLASPLAVGRALTIDASATNGVTVSGNNAVRVFRIQGGVTVTIRGLTIASGFVDGTSDS